MAPGESRWKRHRWETTRGGSRRSGRRRRMRPPSAMAEREGEKGTNGGGVKRPAGGEEARFPGISA